MVGTIIYNNLYYIRSFFKKTTEHAVNYLELWLSHVSSCICTMVHTHGDTGGGIILAEHCNVQWDSVVIRGSSYVAILLRQAFSQTRASSGLSQRIYFEILKQKQTTGTKFAFVVYELEDLKAAFDKYLNF